MVTTKVTLATSCTREKQCVGNSRNAGCYHARFLLISPVVFPFSRPLLVFPTHSLHLCHPLFHLKICSPERESMANRARSGGWLLLVF